MCLWAASASLAAAQENVPPAEAQQPPPAADAAPPPVAGASQEPVRSYDCRRLRNPAELSEVTNNLLAYWMLADQVAKLRVGPNLLQTWQSQAAAWTPNECEAAQSCAMRPDGGMQVTQRERSTIVNYAWQPQGFITLSRETTVVAMCHVARDPSLPPPPPPRRRGPRLGPMAEPQPMH
jgi:hypothetical protein